MEEEGSLEAAMAQAGSVALLEARRLDTGAAAVRSQECWQVVGRQRLGAGVLVGTASSHCLRRVRRRGTRSGPGREPLALGNTPIHKLARGRPGSLGGAVDSLDSVGHSQPRNGLALAGAGASD